MIYFSRLSSLSKQLYKILLSLFIIAISSGTLNLLSGKVSANSENSSPLFLFDDGALREATLREASFNKATLAFGIFKPLAICALDGR